MNLREVPSREVLLESHEEKDARSDDRTHFFSCSMFGLEEDFRDFWIAQAGSKGIKLDWAATWRRWVRTAKERRKPIANITPLFPAKSEPIDTMAAVMQAKRNLNGQ